MSFIQRCIKTDQWFIRFNCEITDERQQNLLSFIMKQLLYYSFNSLFAINTSEVGTINKLKKQTDYRTKRK